MNDRQLAEISEEATRYFCGWKPKEVGKRRLPAFESKVLEILKSSDKPNQK